MVDPISVISLVEGSIGLVLQCGSVVRTLSDIRAKFKHAEIAIMSLIDEVETIQFAWSRIKEWSEDHAEAATDTRFVQRLEKSLQCGTIVLSALEQDLADYKNVADNASFILRSKMAWNEHAFLDHQHRVRGQVQAMGLLLQLSQLSTSKAQTKLLEKKEKVFRTSDESAYSIVPSRMSSRMSISTRSRDSLLSTESKELVYYPLSFEDDLFTARVYKRNYRKPWVNSLSKLQKGKKREGGRVSTAKLEDSEDGPSLQTPPSGMATPTTMSVDFSQPNLTNQEIPLRDLRSVPLSPSITAATKADPTNHEGSLIIAGSVASTFEESPSIGTGLQNGAMESSVKSMHPTELQSGILGARSPAPDRIPQTDIESNMEVAPPSLAPEAQYDLNRALLLAVEEKNLDVVWTLFNQGTPISIHNVVDRTPLHLAVCIRDVSMTQFLLQEGSNCAQECRGKPPAHQAYEDADIQIVRLLLDAGADPNSINGDGKTALHLLASVTGYPRRYHWAIFRLLHEYGANIDAEDKLGDTPIHLLIKHRLLYDYFSWHAYNGLFKDLLAHGANLNAPNRAGDTLLHILVTQRVKGSFDWTQRRDAIQLLLKYRVNVNAQNRAGYTPLHILVTQGLKGWTGWTERNDAIRLLLQHGVNVNAQNRDENTPLHILVTQKREVWTYWTENHDAIRLLLEYGVNVNAQNRAGDTPLHILVIRDIEGWLDSDDYLIVFRSLIANGAQVNIQNVDGDTPLHILARRAHSVEQNVEWIDQLIRRLIDADADLFVKNLMEETPWQLLGLIENRTLLHILPQARPQHMSMSEYDEGQSGIPF